MRVVEDDLQTRQQDLGVRAGVRAVEGARRLKNVLVAQRRTEGHPSPAEVPAHGCLTHGACKAAGQTQASAELDKRALGA